MAFKIGIGRKFYTMTLADWELTKLAYFDNELEEWKRTRQIAYMTYAANFQDAKPIDKWMPLANDPVIEIITETNPDAWIALAKRLNGK